MRRSVVLLMLFAISCRPTIMAFSPTPSVIPAPDSRTSSPSSSPPRIESTSTLPSLIEPTHTISPSPMPTPVHQLYSGLAPQGAKVRLGKGRSHEIALDPAGEFLEIGTD